MSNDITELLKEEEFQKYQPKFNDGIQEALDDYLPTWESEVIEFDDLDSYLESKCIRLESSLRADGTIVFRFIDVDTEENLFTYLK